MFSNGSTIARFYSDRDSVIVIASQLISRQSIILELQRELVEESKTLERTVAGAFILEDVSEMRARYKQELRDLESLVQTLHGNDRAMRIKIQNDRTRHQEWLQTVKEDEDRLRRDIATEVRAEIEKAKEKKSSGIWKAIPLLPSLLEMIEIFVSLSSESASLVASWFSSSGVAESVTEFFTSN